MSPRVEAWTEAFTEVAALERSKKEHQDDGLPQPCGLASRLLMARAEKTRAYGKLRGAEIREACDWLAAWRAEHVAR